MELDETIKCVFLSLSHIIALLEQYKYLVIFPVTVIEGPIVTVISGFLIHRGDLNYVVAYPLLVVADFMGDLLHYFLGRYCSKFNWFNKFLGFFGYDQEKEKIIEQHFEKHKDKTLLLAKVSHGIGGFVQIVAGMIRVNLTEFTLWSLIGTIPKTLGLLLLGYYIGNSYTTIDSYFDFIATVTISIFALVLVYFLFKKIANKLLLKK